MKRCLKCGETKPFDAFHRGGRDGWQAWCKTCRKVYDHADHQKTKGLRVRQKRVLKRKSADWLRALKDGRPCVDCGGVFHPEAMHFDHRPESGKEFDVGFGNGRYSRARVLAEIAKCDLVCANCHAVRTYDRRGVAQPGRALPLGGRSRRFESDRPD